MWCHICPEKPWIRYCTSQKRLWWGESQAWTVSKVLLNGGWESEQHCFSIAASGYSGCPSLDCCQADLESCTTLASLKSYFSEMLKLCLSGKGTGFFIPFPHLETLFKFSNCLKDLPSSSPLCWRVMVLCKRKHRLENRLKILRFLLPSRFSLCPRGFLHGHSSRGGCHSFDEGSPLTGSMY